MKYRLIAVIFLLLNLQAFSQWNWISPLPQGQGMNCIWFHDADTGVLAGGAGTIMKTGDGGNTWDIQLQGTYGTSSSWNDIWFTDVNTGYMVGNSRFIYKTTDGGVSWVQVYEEMQSEGVHSITFTDNDHGFVAGSGGLLLETNNAGNSWTRRILSPPDYFMSVRFASSLNGNIVGLSGTILHTSDCGSTWAVQIPENTSRLEGVHFASADEGFIYGYDGVIYKTTDAGTSWILHNDLDSLSYIAMSSFNKDTLVMIGMEPMTHGDMMIFRSVDGGDSWSTIKIYGHEPAPYQLFCLDDGVAYATGSMGSIFKSEDAGVSWNMISSRLTDNYISCFDFPSADVGYASMYNEEFADNITVLKTIDGGNSWFALDSLFGSEVFFTVDFPTEETGYIGGENIYRTTDGGETWTQQYQSGWTNMIYSISFSIASRGIAVGANGLILRTTNLGFTWTQVESGTSQTLRSVYMADMDTGFICGDKVFLKTTDGGATWNLTSMNDDLHDLSFLSARVGYIAATGGILFTDDGGATFTDVAPPYITTPIRHVHFYDADTGYAAGGTYISSSLLLKTTDGGISWIEEELPTEYPIEAIYVTPANKVFAAGWPGFFFGKSNDIYTSIPVTGSADSEGIVECFPNPFKSSTMISYRIEEPAEVNLAIYDLSVKMVKKITDSHRDACQYNLVLDGSDLESGVYYYKLKINERVLTGKTVRIR